MKWSGSSCMTVIVAIALFVLFSVTASAQGGYTSAGPVCTSSAMGAIEAVGAGAIIAYGMSPAQQIAARRAVYSASLAPDTHAVAKHGNEAQTAYDQTANPSKPEVTKYDCKDGRQRTVNWTTGAIRVEQNGQVITAFQSNDLDYLKRALLRDGCIEEMPTRAVGHDDVRQIPNPWPYAPGAVPFATGQYGPVKTGTPTALELAQARRAAQGGGVK